MTYGVNGTVSDPGPYWRAELPRTTPKEDLFMNRPAVERVMKATNRRLDKDTEWRHVYESQLKDLVALGFAREIMQSEIDEHLSKGGPIYDIAHQLALNHGSKSTPVCTVFNGSQQYRGHSLNSSWALGPEELINNLAGMLLRFREDVHAAQGDIRKMYYCVRIHPEDQMMQLWIWKFDGGLSRCVAW